MFTVLFFQLVLGHIFFGLRIFMSSNEIVYFKTLVPSDSIVQLKAG
jgi:hypothetical protein